MQVVPPGYGPQPGGGGGREFVPSPIQKPPGLQPIQSPPVETQPSPDPTPPQRLNPVQADDEKVHTELQEGMERITKLLQKMRSEHGGRLQKIEGSVHHQPPKPAPVTSLSATAKLEQTIKDQAIDYEKLGAAVAGALKPEFDQNRALILEVLSKMGGIDRPDPQQGGGAPPIDGDPESTAWSHLVLIAPKDAAYWPRLEDGLRRAQAYYANIKHREPPADVDLGPMPFLVAYQNGQAARTYSGLREVEVALTAITRGDFDAFLFKEAGNAT